MFNVMVSTEASWWNILNLKIYTILGYIVSLILLNFKSYVYLQKHINYTDDITVLCSDNNWSDAVDKIELGTNSINNSVKNKIYLLCPPTNLIYLL